MQYSAEFCVYFAIGIAGYLSFGPVIEWIAPSVYLPVISELWSPIYAAWLVIIWAFAVIVAGACYWGFGQMLQSPVTEISINESGVGLRCASQNTRTVSWRDTSLQLTLDVYSSLLAQPNEDGLHWGRIRFVRGHGAGLCQVDDIVLREILNSATSAGVEISRRGRTSLEGPVERLRFSWRGPVPGGIESRR